MTSFSRFLILWLCTVPAAMAGHDLPLYAERVSDSIPLLTNSMIMVWLATAIIVVFCRIATRKMTLVPSSVQNFAEWVVETLYDFLTTILGPYMVKKTFWFFAGLFLLILVTNWLALIPGVGTLGWKGEDGHWLPLLRGGNADLNMTMAMASVFALLWFYWAIKENGLGGFLHHIFAPKGSFKGLMLALMVPIFLFVGLLEVISIAVRPVALTFRLFGNIYGGEKTLEQLMGLMPSVPFLPVMPFYFLELLVGFVQALVFMLLTAVFLRLITEHAGEEHHH
jgi:F-type H+-transporting ATPase subunit a